MLIVSEGNRFFSDKHTSTVLWTAIRNPNFNGAKNSGIVLEACAHTGDLELLKYVISLPGVNVKDSLHLLEIATK